RRRRRGMRAARDGRRHAGRGGEARGERGRKAGQAGLWRAGPGHVRNARAAGGSGVEVRRLMQIALIGYGEVGRILGEDLRAVGHEATAFDLKLRSDAGKPMRAHAAAHRVTLAESHGDAVRSAELVVSAVTASQTVAAAEACARGLRAGSFFLDLNS